MVSNLKDLMKKFSNEKKCREFLIQQRWNGKPVCPHCGHDKVYGIENNERFKCANAACYKKFSVTVGTVFHASNIPLTKWFPAMYLVMAHKKGISSMQLAKDLGVTQKTGWFMLHRIRESLKENHPEMLMGTVESDETYMSRKYRSDYKGLSEEEIDRIEANKFSKKSKGAVLGIVNRETDKIIVKSFDENKSENISGAIRQYVEKGSNLYTDESRVYHSLENEYNRQSINHGKRQWVKDNVHTNHVEAFWSVMKRGVYGIYHQISFKHLQAYCNEFSYRYNSRKIKDGERFSVALTHIEGRLTYKQLVHGKAEENNSQKDQ